MEEEKQSFLVEAHTEMLMRRQTNFELVKRILGHVIEKLVNVATED